MSEKRVRKANGSTTVVRDGRIVGNLGGAGAVAPTSGAPGVPASPYSGINADDSLAKIDDTYSTYQKQVTERDHTPQTQTQPGGTCTRYLAEEDDGIRRVCGAPTPVGKDWCGKCPGFKKAKAPKATDMTRATPAPKGDGELVSADEVVRCSGQVTDPRNGALRQCKNAVRAPATACHDHGGALETSLFKTHAKATAEANRGELTMPTKEELDANPDAARAAMEQDLATLLSTDPSAFLRMSEAVGNWNKEHTVARFSFGNQMIVLGWAYHAERERDPDLDPSEALDRAILRAQQPMHTKKAWEQLGRTINAGARPTPVLVYKPAMTKTEKTVDETTGEEEEKVVYRTGPKFSSHNQYYADQTSGDPLPEQPMDPLDRPLPPGHGDPKAFHGWLSEQAAVAGVTVVEDTRPPAGGAKAYYSPSEKAIHLYAGHAGGDEVAQLRAFAHELGHVVDPDLDHAAYGNSGCTERGRAEVFADSFAYLLCKRNGFDSAESTAGYVEGWSRRFGGMGSKDTVNVMKKALSTVHELMYGKGK